MDNQACVLSAPARWLLIATAALVLCSCRASRPQLSESSFGYSNSNGAIIMASATKPAGQTPHKINPQPAVAAACAVELLVTDRAAPGSASAASSSTATHVVVTDDRPAPDEVAAERFDSVCGCRTLVPGSSQPPTGARDEYICDGGDARYQADFNSEWEIVGVDQEDTVAHFDTLDGRVVLQPSNRVCIYSPRFAAVRKVSGVAQHERRLILEGIQGGQQLEQLDESEIATSASQPIGTERHVGTYTANSLDELQGGVGLDNQIGPEQFWRGFLPHENLNLIRRGVFEQSESARLETLTAAAKSWSVDQAAQIVIDGVEAVIQSAPLNVQSVYRYETPPGNPRLRLVKIASADDARPGDLVDFTIRFDNIGDQRIGHVTIVDHLTTRLEYVADSAQCSKAAEFSSEVRDLESLELRWEITESLQPGDGGIIRFRCRVQ